MKTTIEISDDLLARSRRLLKQQGGTLRALLEEGLTLALKARVGRKGKPAITPVTFAGRGLQEPMRGRTWVQVRDTIYPHDRD